ncbi:hypothetical protein ACDY96_30350 [Rhizobium mongolense]|uniref:hypothetical protein n=1 Tax=Rhizobium mongolense TaxID=57676 RepID=UPI0035588924
MNNGLIQLNAAELALRRALKSAGAPPFIAHAPITDRDRKFIEKEIPRIIGGVPEKAVTVIRQFPAATCWLMVQALSNDYGSETHRIYEPICKSLGLSGFPATLRPELSKRFRSACFKLGLTVASGYARQHVDDYIVQSGVALHQLKYLAEAFIRAEAVIGTPVDDDTERLKAWERRAVDFANPGLTRIRSIVNWDESAFYSQLYARLRSGIHATSTIEAAFAEQVDSIEKSGKFSRASLDEPVRLLFVEDSLVLAAPAAAGVYATFNGRRKWVGPGRRLHLTPPWPVEITWTREDREGEFVLSLPSEELPIFLFDPVSGSQLKVLNNKLDLIAASIGSTEVAIVGRRQFTANGSTSFELGSSAHALIMAMGSGIELKAGSRTIQLKPPMRPAVEINAQKIASGSAGDLLGMPSSLVVRFPNGRPEGDLVLQLSHPSFASDQFLSIPEGAEVEIPLLEKLQAGLAGPLQVSVGFGAGNRVLFRSSTWIWPGLRSLIDGVQFDGPIPGNIRIKECQHLVVDNNQLHLDLSESYRSATVVFGSHAGAPDSKSFAVYRPGTTVSIVDEDGFEREVQHGASLPVLPNTTSSLLIRSDDLNAALDVRGTVFPGAFGRSGTRRIPLASLATPAPHDHVNLWPDGDVNAVRSLVRISASTTPSDFSAERDRGKGRTSVKFRLRVPIAGIRVEISDLVTSELVARLELYLGQELADDRAADQITVKQASRSDNDHIIEVAIRPSPEGPDIGIGIIWVLHAGHERWSELRSSRGDTFPVLISARVPTIQELSELGLSEKLYMGTTDFLNRCHAAEAESALRACQSLWKGAGSDLVRNAEQTKPLFRSLTIPMPLDANSTWVPLHHPIEIDPDLLSSPFVSFQGLKGCDEDLKELFKLHILAEMGNITDAMATFSVSPIFYTSFANFATEARQSAPRLRGFDISTYVANASSGDAELAAFWKPRDQRLTLRHHSWCMQRFVNRFETIAPDGQEQNGLRTQRLNQLVNSGQRELRKAALPAPEGLSERLTLSTALPGFVSELCRHARMGQSRRFWEKLATKIERPSSEVLSDVGFLLRLAPDLFAFYLLLWELVRRSEAA